MVVLNVDCSDSSDCVGQSENPQRHGCCMASFTSSSGLHCILDCTDSDLHNLAEMDINGFPDQVVWTILTIFDQAVLYRKRLCKADSEDAEKGCSANSLLKRVELVALCPGQLVSSNNLLW